MKEELLGIVGILSINFQAPNFKTLRRNPDYYTVYYFVGR